MIIVDATVVEPENFCETAIARSRLEIFLTLSFVAKNLISFLRSFQNTPELFLMEKAIKKGYLIADIKLEFDSNGDIKNNYVKQ